MECSSGRGWDLGFCISYKFPMLLVHRKKFRIELGLRPGTRPSAGTASSNSAFCHLLGLLSNSEMEIAVSRPVPSNPSSEDPFPAPVTALVDIWLDQSFQDCQPSQDHPLASSSCFSFLSVTCHPLVPSLLTCFLPSSPPQNDTATKTGDLTATFSEQTQCLSGI